MKKKARYIQKAIALILATALFMTVFGGGVFAIVR